MVSVHEAFQIIQSVRCPVGIETLSLTDSVGRVLAETVVADRDFPPFNRVAMDGIAVSSKSFEAGQREYEIESVQAAGQPGNKLQDLQKCVEVMTGAILPEGTDVVIRYEDIELKGNHALVKISEVKKGMNIHPQAQDAKAGEVLLRPGQRISPADVALLAAVGKPTVQVKAFPRTAIISSGDELVELNVAPARHQQRRSNVYALHAAMKEAGWRGELFHLNDSRSEIEIILADLLKRFDILILSGGVSKGKFDFIPQALAALGVEKKIHQVSQRPGKPFWFGNRSDGKVVFALPGNPVSTYVCFYRYILPWMMQQMGVVLKPEQAILAEDVMFTPPLTYFLQVSTFFKEGKRMARPVPGGGSGDFVNLKDVDGFMELPAGKSEFKTGEYFPYIGFRA
ncbi:MAG: molybdopterin molybdotransferase MoeA [Flammeovirgaceae bacterium]|nr:MAG: molybdopterin molybdotransferase MoeA [Flammeovirgaceae bacterium]